MSLTGKTIAITGSASGIGQATARECATRGATALFLSDLNISALDTFAEELRTSFPKLAVTATQLDVTKSAAVDSWIHETVTENGTKVLDGACNIAGVDTQPGEPSWKRIVDTSDEHWSFLHDVNLNGVFYCLRAEMRVMKRGASIVNAASTGGLRGGNRFAAYCSSKHAVVGLSKSAAKEGGPLGVRVNAVCPGPIDTPLLRRMMSHDPVIGEALEKAAPLGGLGKVQDVAKTFCYLLGEDSSWISGTTITVDGASQA